MPRPNSDALLATVREFWPEAEVRRAPRRWGPGRSGAVHKPTFAYLPNARRAKMLVPTGRPRAAAAALRKFSASLGPREALQRAAVAWSMRVGGSIALTDEIVIGPSADSMQAYLADALGERVGFSLSLGSARANRKPILQVFDRRGTSLGYAKIGDNPRARRDVEDEATSLRRLAGRLPTTLEVPTVLHEGEWRDMYVLIISGLDVAARQPRDAAMRVPVEAMRDLCEAFRGRPAALTRTPMWEPLTSAVAGLTNAERRSTLLGHLDRMAALAGEQEYPVGAWHGDWTSWNMSYAPGRLQVWDWERFAIGVIDGLDACHFAVQARTRRDGYTADNMLLALRGLAPFGMDAMRWPIVPAVYLASLAKRYSVSAEGLDGELIAEQAAQVTEVLGTWLGEIGK